MPVGLAALLIVLAPIQFVAFVRSDPPRFRFASGKTIVHRQLRTPFAGDVNGDGQLDIVAGLGNGLAVLPGPGLSVPSAEFAPMELAAVVDADADGDLDVIALTAGATQRSDSQCQQGKGSIVVTLRNDGQDRFTPLPCGLPSEVRPVGFGDIDGDGRLDVLLESSQWPAEPWIVGTAAGLGGGRFGRPQAIAGPPREALPARGTVLEDMDGDGRPDLVALTSNVPAIYRNLGDGRFGEPSGRPSASVPVEAFTLVDLDRDERPDVVGLTHEANRLAVFWNQDGALMTGPTLSSGLPNGATWATIVRGGDLDGDGDVDLLLRTQPVSEDRQPPGADETRVWLQSGGTFSGPRALADRSVRADLLVDLDGDGIADVVGPGYIVLSRPA